MSRILLVEDDESLGATLTERLGKEGYQVCWARSKAHALSSRASEAPFDLWILDIGLPDGSGLDLARDLQLSGDISIIFLSAMASAEYRLEGFELGALDYIPKPFHLRELLLRVKRALARTGSDLFIEAGKCRLNIPAMAVTFADGTSVQPPPRDFQLLRLLVQRAPDVLSREQILTQLWPGETQQSGRTVDNAIMRLRQLLRPAGEELISSVRGVGYRWNGG